MSAWPSHRSPLRRVLSEGDVTHHGYLDESYPTTGRFRSVAMVSVKAGMQPAVESAFGGVIQRRLNGDEARWEKVRGERRATCACDLLEAAFVLGDRCMLRIDVLYWDIFDRYHSVQNLDHVKNINRMASRLLKRVCLNRYQGSAAWLVRPDDGSIVNWRVAVSDTEDNLIQPRRNGSAAIKGVLLDEVDSASYALVQVADMFAGIATFTANEADLVVTNPLPPLGSLSWSKRYRLPIIERLLVLAKERGHRTSVRHGTGLSTSNPAAPINFWPFRTPRGEGVAPRRLPVL